ncbi:hypothetical protein HDE_01151 [Halotydeus destructor]|nr:hypothetical protein HDE_01151 [Halotydeus destructor]
MDLNSVYQHESVNLVSEYRFADLSDDVLRDIFKYSTATERVRLEVLNRRFGEIMPTISLTFEYSQLPYLYNQGARETEVFFHMVRKSTSIKNIDFDLVCPDALLSMYIDSAEGTRLGPWVMNTNVESVALRLADDRLSNVHLAVDYASDLGSNCRVKFLDINVQLYSARVMDVGMKRFTELIRLCPNLDRLRILIQNSHISDETIVSPVYQDLRYTADIMWCVIAGKVKELHLRHFEDTYPEFGKLHYTGHSWVNLTKVTICNDLTPTYLERLVNDAPKLEWISLIVEDLTALTAISKLDHLKFLKLKYRETSEPDHIRRNNGEIFHRFIQRRGEQLKEIFLTCPYQNAGFFDPIENHCNPSLVTKLRRRGTPKHSCTIDSLTKLLNVRRLQLDSAVCVEKVKRVLAQCPKLRKFVFVIPAYERLGLESLKSDIVDYSSKCPQRSIEAKIKLAGSDKYQSYLEFRFGRLLLMIDEASVLAPHQL